MTITSPCMTRFWMTLDQSVELVLTALRYMVGGEIFVPKLPAVTIPNLAQAIAPNTPIRVIGVRAGEKMDEVMIGPDESANALEYSDHFRIVREPEVYLEQHGGRRMESDTAYSSCHARMLSTTEIREDI